ncbi:H-type small acid-soluble spore protein [Halobacillus sp. A1]|uniref:Small, acid-soluble spore protein H n=1 Tax=Halobacillus campisalis TaxID=435909 RepID=A0ABW2K3H8_9BACI|nr:MULTISPECIES: H-type small acid-soluble spore protein [Halobacillus]MCP3031888.1 H-type small acid-soluble spore protein [Halobacillus sp. A1]
MNRQRAEEIAASPVMASVTFNNMKVYIQHVNENGETARIYDLSDPKNELDVSLDELNEVYQ